MRPTIGTQLERARLELRDHLAMVRHRLIGDGELYRPHEHDSDFDQWQRLRQRIALLEDIAQHFPEREQVA